MTIALMAVSFAAGIWACEKFDLYNLARVQVQRFQLWRKNRK